MSDALIDLGPGNGSGNEALKLHSGYLRGGIAESLAGPGSHLSADDEQLLKFHGSYQQEDRDQRRARREAKLEKAYQFMVRSRIPGGALTSAQYLAHDDLADAYGNGTMRLTTRQSIQLHGILKGDLKRSIKAINDALLSTLAACGDVNRNVMACPAPVAGAARAQIQAVAHAIAMHLAPRTGAYHEIWLDGEKVAAEGPAEEIEPIYGATYLPRKFKIGIAYPGDNCIDVFTQDIGLVAVVEDERLTGFTVAIGGGLGSTHGKAETYPRLATPLCFVAPEEVLDVAEAILTVQRDYGDRTNRKHARMKYVVEERGVAWFRERVETRLGRALADPLPIAFDDADDHLGWHEGADGTWFLGILVENGRVVDRVTSMLRSALREVAERFAPDLRITAQQNLLLVGIAPEQRPQIDALFHRYGVRVDPARHGVGRRSMACPALPTCGQAVAEAERALPALLERVEAELARLDLDGDRLSVRMTGCPNGCARPRLGDIGIVGRSLGLYDLYLGGDVQNTRLNALYAKGVALDAIVPTLRIVLEAWKREGREGEPLGDFAYRFGVERLAGETAALPA